MNETLTEQSAAKVETFGCRLNAYESQVVREHLEAAGQRNVIVFNTCAVTAESERQARQAIRRARRDRPNAKIIVTGCAAQIAPETWASMPEVDRVVGNLEKMTATTWTDTALADGNLVVSDIMQAKETATHLISGFGGKARAFVEIQQGCDHRCTFCIIPYGRGNSRSAPVGVIARQVQSLVEAGVAEVAFTGVDITSYGTDLPGKPSLAQLTRRVLAQVPDLKRLRLSSIDPAEVDDDLIRLIAEEPRLAGHLHLSLQAGSDLILKRMKRRHLTEDAVRLTERVRELRPDLALGADLIAGFPTETDELFQHTLNHVRELDLTWLHVFPYSPRPGTPAARMPQNSREIVKKRAAILRELGEVQASKYLKNQIGKKVRPVMETAYRGRTDSFAEIELDTPMSIGAMPLVQITDVREGCLLGTMETAL
ncbi:MAG: tRNA (N(6)-L-threonylcarbamoyladenosine(37)-C(2))-methylthiotransferase MtaB [Rhodospirillales bacterium]|jgi:threonylcarbamoyladenosine tRNA methylthiotransferase MtaB